MVTPITFATHDATDADEQAGIVLKYPHGQFALLPSAVRTRTLHNAVIFGSEEIVWIPLFWRARLSVLCHGALRNYLELPGIRWNITIKRLN